LGIFENRPIGLKNATPAEILQKLLEEKWKMRTEDKDMIVMWNQFVYDDVNGNKQELISSLVYKGKNREETAMAITVGLPLAIAARGVITGKIAVTGCHIPTIPEIYEPILAELENCGIKFNYFQNAVPWHSYKHLAVVVSLTKLKSFVLAFFASSLAVQYESSGMNPPLNSGKEERSDTIAPSILI